jgi:hypothetical protein
LPPTAASADGSVFGDTGEDILPNNGAVWIAVLRRSEKLWLRLSAARTLKDPLHFSRLKDHSIKVGAILPAAATIR